jgi:uncharacterized protein (TIGR00297 family)
VNVARLLSSLGLALAAGGLGFRQGWLTASGWAGAVLVGTATAGVGGWQWGLLVIIFFISSSSLSRLGTRHKGRLAAEIWEKGSSRDIGQVLANGGLVSILACCDALWPWPGWWAAAVGALAAVTGDTWATEIGVLGRRPPRLITTGQIVPAGTSGGVTLLGIAATLAGATMIGASALILQLLFDRSADPALFAGAIAGGLAGGAADSLLGATWQSVYRCPRCKVETERRQHSCGALTAPLRGWSWLNNDAVNALASVSGGFAALLVLGVL